MMSFDQKYEIASWERCALPEDAQIEQTARYTEEHPDDGDGWMRRGHALARLSMMREAEECYAMAIACDPFNWEYYRHRAHRMLSCWRFADAAADFTIASRLNPKDWNVWYHLGLSWFLLRDYEKAADAYRHCYELTTRDMDLIAISDWYYMTLKRLGRDEDAARVLDRITEGMDPDENTAYYARLLMYKGLRTPEELLGADPDATTDLELVTMGFGVGNYYLMNGETEKGYGVMRRVVEAGDKSNCYFAFAYLASMVELQNVGKED